MAIVVTGAAGFIGSNLVKALNARGETDIIAVDDLKDGMKFRNLVDCEIREYVDKDQFIEMLIDGLWDGEIQAILHQGACSDTMVHDGKFMMENNYRYTCNLIEYCQQDDIPLIYASSASVYGAGTVFVESREYESPLNIYGYSKFLADQVVRRRMASGLGAQIVGLRYFNVYGPREQHKDRMASVAFHHFNQYRETGRVKLFGAYDGHEAGCQSRDFISVEDVVKVNLFFLDHPELSGVFNCGTGRAEPFNQVALAAVNACRQQQGESPQSLAQLVEEGVVEYIDFPEALKGKYQSYTCADISALREAGYAEAFLNVAEGVVRYGHVILA